MNALLASARTVHFAATLWLFGELLLACALLARRRNAAPSAPGEALRRRLPSVARGCIAIGIVSALLWLAAMAATMSGLPLTRAIGFPTLGAVLGDTLFGKVWIARFCLACVLLLLLWPRTTVPGLRRLAVSTLIAAAYLGALAWTGHAAAAEGPWRGGQIVSDVVHLLSAGAWLGALPALVYVLGSTPSIGDAAAAVKRFSSVAIVAVTALILSGVGNSWFLVGSVPALFGTRYGTLLLAKLAVLAAMLSLAAVNRLILTPRLASGDRPASRALRRNALVEIGAGLLVVAIVGVLGITVPAAHQSTLWPFAHTLSWAPARESAVTLGLVLAAVLVAVAGLVSLIVGARRRAWRPAAAGLIGVGASVIAAAWLLAVPAYPTTYATSPVRYTTAAIADGARLFAAHCAACHGIDSRSTDGTAVAAPNLARQAARHRPGELYWWTAHGRAGTAMPAFSPPLVSEEIWSIVQFLHALADAADFAGTRAGFLAPSPVPAPDFSFELLHHGQQTIVRPDANEATLLVLYSLPDSAARLRSLASQRRAFDDRHIRILALAESAGDAQIAEASIPGGDAIRAIAAPDVAVVYALFAARDRAAAGHAEFLIDRRGRLRARWLGVPPPGDDRDRDIFAAAQKLGSAESAPPSPPEHAH